MPHRYIPLQRKLMRVIMLTCAVVMLLIFSALVVYEYFSFRNIARNELAATALMTADNSTGSLAFQDTTDAQKVLRSLHVMKHIEAAGIYDRKGRLFARYGTGPLPGVLPAIPEGSRYDFFSRHLEGYEPVYEGDRRLGTVYVRSGLGEVYERLALYAGIAALIIGVSALLAIGFSRRLRQTLAAPILELARTAGTVTRDQNYSIRAPRRFNDEVGELTEAFNDMLARIEEKNAEILALNQNLEEKVAQRTQELQSSNRSLQAQKEFTEAIIDASIDLVAVFDRDGHYLVVNDQCVQHFRRSRNELLGQHYGDVFPALRGSIFDQRFREALAGNTISEDAYKSQVSDRWLQNFFIPIRGSDGGVDQVLVIGHDITEVMKSNAQLMQLNSDLEKSNRELEQFAYIASHDLQEPLRKIQTFSDLSLRNLEHRNILERYLEKINSSARRMSNLIRDVLNYSRAARHEGDKREEVELNEVLASVRTDLELVIEEKGAEVLVEPLPAVMGNRLQLGQLFLNLLGNALKFSERAPLVQVRSRVLDAGAARMPLKAGTYSEISVADNGIGFEQQYADKVFSIFQRLHQADSFGGTGIGLAICKKIAENHGGGITVESAPGVGTTFFVYLPLETQPRIAGTGNSHEATGA